MNTTTLVAARRRTAHRARDVLGLFKLRIGVMIMITALVGLVITPGAALSLGQVLTVALSVLVASASAGAYNQYYEHDVDQLMARTRRRAFVTGALRRSPAWLLLIIGLLAGAVAAAGWSLNPMSALFVFLGAFFYAVVYTVWLKRRSWLNIVVGGLAGSFAVLAGAAAVNPLLGPLPLLLALVLFLWTPPHFWEPGHRQSRRLRRRRRADAAGGRRPERAARVVLHSTVALVAASLLPGLFGAGWVYMAGAAAGGAYFVFRGWQLARVPSRATAMVSFFASLVQLSVLLAAATIDGLMR